MIAIPDQPVAERVLRGALASVSPPQQLLLYGPPGTGKRRIARQIAWALIDPDHPHDDGETSLDLSIVAATGASIRLEADLEPALADLATRPVVGRRRVLIIDGAERLREQEGAPRILKQLEEPPPRSHILLVTDRPDDLLPTIRSRCLPVPFRTPGWRAIATRLEAEGMPAAQAEERARADGTLAVASGPYEQAMRALGVELAVRVMRGDSSSPLLVRDIQATMARAADERPSPELARLREEADALAGKRGERTAQKRVEDQQKRERRRALTDGWIHVLDGASGMFADALAVSLGADAAVRHRSWLDELQAIAVPSRSGFLEHALDEIQVTRSELELNPTLDLAVEALLARIAAIRTGTPFPAVHGRLPA